MTQSQIAVDVSGASYSEFDVRSESFVKDGVPRL